MKSILATIMILFLSVNVGVLYYMVLFGDIPEFERRVDVLEKRVDSLIKRDGGEVAGAIDEQVDVQVGESGDLVVLSQQQKDELVSLFAQRQASDLQSLVSSEIADQLGISGGEKVSLGVKEYFVPLGLALVKTNNNEWRDTGLQTEFDLSNYGKVKAVTFEATLSVPTGNGEVGVRLLDATDGVVGGSELSAQGSDPVYRKSGGVSIGEGARVLKVQMRTSLDYEGKMENGRLRIVLE